MNMRKYKVVLAKEAKDDLENIHNYIKDASSEQNADIVTMKILKKISSFDVFPERSEIFVKKDDSFLRATTSGKYRINYTVSKPKKEVVIVRIISISQDQKTAL